MTTFNILVQYGEQLIEENPDFPKFSKLFYTCSLDSVAPVLGLLSKFKTEGVINDFILYPTPENV